MTADDDITWNDLQALSYCDTLEIVPTARESLTIDAFLCIKDEL